MADFQFVAYDQDAGGSTTKDFSTENLDTIIKEFNYFLKGAGFDFPGNIELVLFKDGEPEVEDISLNFDDYDCGFAADVNPTDFNIELYGDTNG